MIFWIIAALMTVGAAATLALPLLRQQTHALDVAEYDMEVYRDQLAELEREHGRDVISDEEMEAARTEIARRMLAADMRRQKQESPGLLGASRAGMSILAAAMAIAMSAGGVLLYLYVGSPGTPDMPLAQRTDLAIAGNEEEHVRKQIAEMARVAKANPGDANVWLRLANAYKSIEMYGEAVAAYRKAVALGPLDAEINGDFAETLVMAGQGTVTPEARTIFETILSATPGDPRPQFYLALGDYQAGRTREALDRWAALIAETPADAPWLGFVRENLAQAAKDLGLDVADVMPEPLPARSGDGPQMTPEQRAEIESMTPDERNAMIREMVEGLDAKLRDDPTNLEGWVRLIRARAMLGERDAAQDALDRGLEAFAKAPVPTDRLLKLATELELDTPAASDGAAVPDIGSMVDGLAARLKDNPDDLQGWIMLARSYTVLEDLAKAREAIDNAVRLAPDNPDVLAQQAHVVRAANGGQDNEETVAIMRRVLELAPDNMDALWVVGGAEADAGNTAKARELLERLLARIPEDNPDREFVKERLNQLDG